LSTKVSARTSPRRAVLSAASRSPTAFSARERPTSARTLRLILAGHLSKSPTDSSKRRRAAAESEETPGVGEVGSAQQAERGFSEVRLEPGELGRRPSRIALLGVEVRELHRRVEPDPVFVSVSGGPNRLLVERDRLVVPREREQGAGIIL
jgi:hypothetical protein